ncbi:MAG: single-stranded DNA-binding protein [Myxococcota bacterium]|nr:single-stranded DNA-binding protein [Myxococcota bacterium]
MQTMNKVMLLGRIGMDPERRQVKSGKTLARFSLATDRAVRQPDGGWETQTEWHQITTWEKTAENILTHARKGDMIALEGRLQYHQWEDPEGRKRTKAGVTAERVSIIGRPQRSQPAQARVPVEASIPF